MPGTTRCCITGWRLRRHNLKGRPALSGPFSYVNCPSDCSEKMDAASQVILVEINEINITEKLDDRIRNEDQEVFQTARGGDVPTYLKYSIGIDEAARYYGIGTKKLRQIISDNPTGDFFLEIGRRVLIKRRQFEAYLDNASSL